MSGEAEPAGAAGESVAKRRAIGIAKAAGIAKLAGNAEITEELGFHLERMVERLCAEGYERAAAEAEARRRFGDLELLTVECAGERAGWLGRVLRWSLAPSGVYAWCVLLLAALYGVTSLLLLGWIAVFAAACAFVAALRPRWSALAERIGRRQLTLLWLVALVCFLRAWGDWVHSLWSIQYPLTGLLMGSGLLLERVWAADRAPSLEGSRGWPGGSRCWSGALIALLGVLVLGLLPALLLVLPTHPPAPANANVSLFPALAEAFRSGFGGDLSAMLLPASASRAAGAPGGPPRIVTVALAASWLAALHWILFVLLALIGRTLREGARRRSFLLIAPVLLAAAASPFLWSPALEHGIWRNEPWIAGPWPDEPWLVRAYGPTLLLALVAGLVLFVLVRLDARFGRPSRSSSPRRRLHARVDSSRPAAGLAYAEFRPDWRPSCASTSGRACAKLRS